MNAKVVISEEVRTFWSEFGPPGPFYLSFDSAKP